VPVKVERRGAGPSASKPSQTSAVDGGGGPLPVPDPPLQRPPGPVWLGLEGISGAGKTTQVNALQPLLTRGWNATVLCTSEFGDDALGRFVADTASGDRLRLGVGREASNHARHLLALSSRIQKMKAAANGTWDAMLFDVATLSDIAHALADLDTAGDAEVRYWLRSGIAPVLQDTAATMHCAGFTFYLRCSPVVAARRLSGRLHRNLTPEELDFLERLATAYDEILTETPAVIEIEAEAKPHVVTAEIVSKLESQLAAERT
jgi:thymidylate kinase